MYNGPCFVFIQPKMKNERTAKMTMRFFLVLLISSLRGKPLASATRRDSAATASVAWYFSLEWNPLVHCQLSNTGV